MVEIIAKKDASVAVEEKYRKNAQTRAVVLKIIESLQETNKAKNSSQVLVHLPIGIDFMGSSTDEWRKFLHAEAARSGFIYIDPTKELRKYPPQEVNSLFDEHYSVKGNSNIANILYEKMLSIPELAGKLWSE